MIKIVDNVLSPSLFRMFENIVMSKSFPWYYGRTSQDYHEDNLFLYSWYHSGFDPLTNEKSPTTTQLEPLILSAFDNADEKFERIIRVRIVCNTITDKPYLAGAHVDIPQEAHKTALLYLNDSDGDTHVYNETYDLNCGMSPYDYYKNVLKSNLTLLDAITPKKNRFICFNGLHYHEGTTPVSTARRVMVNINYI